MEKGNQVQMGSRNVYVKLDEIPPGYHFRPTDAELIENYLKLKISNQTLPPNRIQTLDLYNYHPQQLSDIYKIDEEGDLYIFTPRSRKYPKGRQPNRRGVGGYWKPKGSEISIKSDINGETVGYKSFLVFHQDDLKYAVTTDWAMHEYRIQKKAAPTSVVHGDMKLDEVLCKLYRKKRGGKAEEKKNDEMAPPLPQFNHELDDVCDWPLPLHYEFDDYFFDWHLLLDT